MKRPNPLVGQFVTDGRFSGTVTHYDKDGWMHLDTGILASPKAASTFCLYKKRH